MGSVDITRTGRDGHRYRKTRSREGTADLLGNERGVAMVVVLGLMLLLSLMVAALMTAGNTAARARINAWNQEEAQLAAQAGVQRMIFEAERIMTNNDSSHPYAVSDLTGPPDNQTNPPTWPNSNLVQWLEKIPNEDSLTNGVPLANGAAYRISSPVVTVAEAVINNTPSSTLVDVTVKFQSTGSYDGSSVTQVATVVLEADRWQLPQDVVMLTNLSYQ